MVMLSVEYLKDKQSMEKAQKELKDIVSDQSNQIMNHKMSLGLFKEWTNDLKEKMNTELQVLCENNVKLQVENQILLQRLGPLESMEKQVLAQEDVAVQGMLVTESELGQMRQVMLQVGNNLWKEIRARIEGCVLKPFSSLKSAFVSEYEANLMKKVESLEKELANLRMENDVLKSQGSMRAKETDEDTEMDNPQDYELVKIQKDVVGTSDLFNEELQGDMILKEADVPDSNQAMVLLGTEVQEKLDDSEGLGAIVPISSLSAI